MPIRSPPFISQRTVSRRTVLDWLGKGTVLALSAPILKACATLDGASADAGVPGTDGSGDADVP